MAKKSKTFVTITNQDIYDKQLEQDKKLESIEIQCKLTNGRVNFHRVWLYGQAALSMFILGLIKWG